jgi:hypothetical protein
LKDYQNYKEIRIPEGVYKGQVEAPLSNIRDGYGQMEYVDGSIYFGYWKKDKR